MKKLCIVLTALALSLVAMVAVASPPGKLKCFSGAPATCSVSQNTVTLDTHLGGFAGAFITSTKSIAGTPLSGVTFTFQYDCDPLDDKTSCAGGGSPRWSIPIEADGDNKFTLPPNGTDGYAFLDAHGCGSVGVVNNSSSCAVNFAGIDYTNWAAFATANPTFTIGNALPFVITDTTEPGTTLIFAMSITKP